MNQNAHLTCCFRQLRSATGVLLTLLLCWHGVGSASAGTRTRPALELHLDSRIHVGAILRLAVDRSGQLAASAGEDGTVRLWNLKQQVAAEVFYLPRAEDGKALRVRQLLFHPTGRRLLVETEGRAGNELRQLDFAQGGTLQPLGRLAPSQHSVGYSPDGGIVWVTGPNGIRGYPLSGSAPFDAIADCPEPSGASLAGAPQRLAVICRRSELRVYLLLEAGWQQQARLAIPAVQAHIQLSPDGQQLALLAGRPQRIDLLGADHLTLQSGLDVSQLDSLNEETLAWSGDGTVLAVAAQREGRAVIRRWQGTMLGERNDTPVRTGLVRALLSVSVAAPVQQSPTTGKLRDIVVPARLGQHSFLAATTEPALWILPKAGDATPLQNRRTTQPTRQSLRVDVSGGRVQFRSASGQSVSLSLLEHMAQITPGPDSRLREALRSRPELLVRVDTASGHLLVNGQRAPAELRRPEVWACSASGLWLVAAGEREIWRLEANGKPGWRQRLSVPVADINVSGDGRLVVVATSEGTLHWYTAATGAPLTSAAVLNDGSTWGAWTPSGYFDGSPEGEQLLTAVFPVNSSGLHPWARMTRMQDLLRRPDVVERILFTQSEEMALAEADAVRGQTSPAIEHAFPPQVAIESPQSDVDAISEQLQMQVRVQLPPGIPLSSLQLRVRGAAGRVLKQTLEPSAPLPAQVGDPADLRRFAVTVSLLAEDAQVQVQAQTLYAISEPATIRVHWRGPARTVKATLPNLYILAIGISQYREAALRLEYPAKDARDLVALLRQQAGKLYGQVHATTLLDREGTRSRILSELARLRRSVSEDDVVLVFLAGHGVSDALTGRYHFYPADADPADMATTTLPAADLRNVMLTLPGKVVLMLDTCHAGGALDRRAALHEGDVSRLAAQMATAESNIVVFTASTGMQVARESARWGNGVFTKAVLEGLRGRADLAASGHVSVSQLEAYVSKRVRELTEEQQTPSTMKPTSTVDYPIAQVPLPLSRRWWFWGSIGLAVSGLVVGSVLAVQPWREPLPRVSF